jgi:hypothetical protein
MRREGQGLGEGDAEEHGGAHGAGRIRLLGHRPDGVADHEADADARPDGGEAVAQPCAEGAQALFRQAEATAVPVWPAAGRPDLSVHQPDAGQHPSGQDDQEKRSFSAPGRRHYRSSPR